jgi:4-amino-4-deoxy-L-arabinose transferase-like glycosyltransferase
MNNMISDRSKELHNNFSRPVDAWFTWLIIIGIVVNASGLLLPILEPDGALYATLAKNMVLRGDYINLFVDGKDWLDKPHFPFWITAFSFKIFGINSFAYKLPALLFWLAGAWYTYAFANKLYNKQTAQWALLIYLSVEHLIISNNDVRAEPYLTGLMIGTAYYYYLAYRSNKWKYYIAGSLLLAFAIMTKGIFIACMVMAGFFIDWIIKKEWKQFLNYRWWLSMVLVLLFIMPELISLYLQFDRHPEKLVFAQQNVSGIRFFFWDSQFGRFFNTGPIKGKGDKLFYVHTMIWAFLPWSIIFFVLIGSYIKKYKTILSPTGNPLAEQPLEHAVVVPQMREVHLGARRPHRVRRSCSSRPEHPDRGSTAVEGARLGHRTELVLDLRGAYHNIDLPIPFRARSEEKTS